MDARYEKVRHGGQVVDCAIFIASGVDREGHRQLLGVSVSLSEAEMHWRAFLEGLLAKAIEEYERLAPSLADWMAQNIPEGFTVLLGFSKVGLNSSGDIKP